MSKASDARKVLAKHGPALVEMACKLATGKLPVEELADPGCIPPDTKLLATLIRQLPNVRLEDDPPPQSLAQKKTPVERAEGAIEEYLQGKITLIQANMIVDLFIKSMDAQEANRLLRVLDTLRDPSRGFL